MSGHTHTDLVDKSFKKPWAGFEPTIFAIPRQRST
jgi:hypothetical protein